MNKCMKTDPNKKCMNTSLWNGETDFCRFYASDVGIAKITHDRWQQAQVVESSVWNGNTVGDDGSDQHAFWFDEYRALDGLLLGRILEIGSGPFTQVKTLLTKVSRRSLVQLESITLADPLMIFYHQHVPSCPYKDGSLL